jgi:molecular chaperone GrpE
VTGATTAATAVEGVTLDDVARQLAELSDLFRRRLLEDRAKNETILALRQHLQAREELDTGAAFDAVFTETLLAVDRLVSEDASAELAASVATEILEVLGRRGLRALPSEGRADPTIHEIVGQEAGHPDVEVGEILEVRRRGYTLGDRLLRPAQVVVAAAPKEGAE